MVCYLAIDIRTLNVGRLCFTIIILYGIVLVDEVKTWPMALIRRKLIMKGTNINE